MNGSSALVVVAAVCLNVACSSGLRVSSDFDPAVDFSSYHTYALMPAGHRVGVNDLISSRIDVAVATELEGRGLTRQGGGTDLLVAWHLVLTRRFDLTTTGTAYGAGYWGRYGGARATGMSRTTADTWTQGTLIIDVIDRARDRLVYRASGQSRVEEQTAPAERTKRISEAVKAILADLPVPQSR